MIMPIKKQDFVMESLEDWLVIQINSELQGFNTKYCGKQTFCLWSYPLCNPNQQEVDC